MYSLHSHGFLIGQRNMKSSSFFFFLEQWLLFGLWHDREMKKKQILPVQASRTCYDKVDMLMTVFKILRG